MAILKRIYRHKAIILILLLMINTFFCVHYMLEHEPNADSRAFFTRLLPTWLLQLLLLLLGWIPNKNRPAFIGWLLLCMAVLTLAASIYFSLAI